MAPAALLLGRCTGSAAWAALQLELPHVCHAASMFLFSFPSDMLVYVLPALGLHSLHLYGSCNAHMFTAPLSPQIAMYTAKMKNKRITIAPIYHNYRQYLSVNS